LRVSKLEEKIGIEIYASSETGIGGVIKQFPEDFIVEEILVDGSKAEIYPSRSYSLDGKGRYLICALVKRDWDTLLVMKRISQSFGLDSEMIGFAGLKDTRALTAQHISLSMISPEKIKQFYMKDVEIRPIKFSDNKISSCMLFGNNFRIKIRAIRCSSSLLKTRVLKIRHQLEECGGVPNFYGHQRFGTVRAITHVVGKALVKGDLKKAVLVFLAKPSVHEHTETYKARLELWRSQDFKTALKIFPYNLKYERAILYHLSKYPNDFEGAFKRIPLKLRKLFVQAYQSYLFNKFLSQRLHSGFLPNQVIVGDFIVMLDEHGLPTRKFVVATHTSKDKLQKMVDKNKACIVLPIVGFKQSLSKGFQGEMQQAVLEEESVSPEDFKIKKAPELSSKGGLRLVCTPLLNFSIDEVAEDSANPSKRVMQLSFALLRGSYATVVLREFMKPRNVIKAGF